MTYLMCNMGGKINVRLKKLKADTDVYDGSNQSILKEVNPEYSLEGLILKLKLQYFGHLRQRANSLEKTLMLGKIEGERRRVTPKNEMIG